MKKCMLTLLIFLQVFYSYGQSGDVDAEIRRLEKMEVDAVLRKDSILLLKLWDKDFVVNAPDNVVVFAGKTTLDRPVLTRGRTVFTREVEQVTVRGNFAISMGSETVVPAIEGANSAPLKRRYTNFWEKGEGGWKLVARHANVICKP